MPGAAVGSLAVDGTVWTIVVAAGRGERFGGPKQLADLGGVRVIDLALDAARAAGDGVVVVVPPEGTAWGLVADAVVVGGATRSASVRRGLEAVPADAGVVLVHDAARPLATPALYARVVAAVRAGAEGVVPAVAVVDTVRSLDGAPVDRDRLRSVQTPQGFPAAVLRRVHATGGDATDDAGLVEAAGGRIALVEGERANLKITEAADLAVASALRGARTTMQLRVGNGFDVHRFADDDRPLVLGGVRFEGERGLAGHSDADVVAHAVAEALLGAAGLGDIGSHFPDTDPRWAGANSLVLLAEVRRQVGEAGWSVANVDCSVVAERPKLAPRRVEMEERLSEVVGAPVTVKGRRAEGIGGLGRGEGVVAMATALLSREGVA